MIQDLPAYISVVFALTTLATVVIFHFAVLRSKSHPKLANYITGGLILWMAFHTVLALSGFFNSVIPVAPPRFIILPLPLVLLIVLLFTTKRGKEFIDDLPMLPLTWLHTVRVPVELVLYWLYLHAAVPELMTFAGRNFDILAGITAPLIAYFGIQREEITRTGLLAWNVLCLGLLINIVTHAVLSLPTSFQQLALDRPNIAVLNFPFVWLPGVVVPLVLFSHLVAIRRLLTRNSL